MVDNFYHTMWKYRSQDQAEHPPDQFCPSICLRIKDPAHCQSCRDHDHKFHQYCYPSVYHGSSCCLRRSFFIGNPGKNCQYNDKDHKCHKIFRRVSCWVGICQTERKCRRRSILQKKCHDPISLIYKSIQKSKSACRQDKFQCDPVQIHSTQSQDSHQHISRYT